MEKSTSQYKNNLMIYLEIIRKGSAVIPQGEMLIYQCVPQDPQFPQRVLIQIKVQKCKIFEKSNAAEIADPAEN